LASSDLRTSAVLSWAGTWALPSGGAHTDTWSGQVYDPLTDAGSLTDSKGRSVTISAPKVPTPPPSRLQLPPRSNNSSQPF
jgi:hypothetical protein